MGTDGKEKMSQSLGNYVSIRDAPNEMFGKTMSIPDALIRNWFELCTDVPLPEVDALLAEGRNPRDAKVRLGREIVALYHGEAAAETAVAYFVETFSKRQQPTEVPEGAIPSEFPPTFSLAYLLSNMALLSSARAARTQIADGGIRLDGEKMTDVAREFSREELDGAVLQYGKHRFVRLAA